jgi:hypothetical protein
MNHKNQTSYKFDVEFQKSLFDFMGDIENIYDTLNLKLSDKEKIKIEQFRICKTINKSF